MILDQINEVHDIIRKVLAPTPILIHKELSKKYEANIYLKREDIQNYKSPIMRGVFNALYQQTLNNQKSLVCCEDHMYWREILISCCLLRKDVTFFVSSDTLIKMQKQILKLQEEPNCNDIEKYVKYVAVEKSGKKLKTEATSYALKYNNLLIDTINKSQIILGQSIIGMELLSQLKLEIDYIFVPIDTGLTAVSICLFFKQKNSKTKIIGVKVENTSKLKKQINSDKKDLDEDIDRKKMLDNVYEIYYYLLDGIVFNETHEILTPSCTFFTEDFHFDLLLHNSKTIKSLNTYKEDIKGKNIVCLVNNLFS
jgi:threonine dehydratase